MCAIFFSLRVKPDVLRCQQVAGSEASQPIHRPILLKTVQVWEEDSGAGLRLLCLQEHQSLVRVGRPALRPSQGGHTCSQLGATGTLT